MVNIYLAYTEPINPAGVSPTLTIPIVWAGLRRKVVMAQDFIQPIINTEVLEENDTYIKRRVYFNTSYADSLLPQAIDDVNLYPPMRVEFLTETGTVINNIVSVGPKGLDEGDIYLTFTFQWQFPQVQAGSAEEEQKQKIWFAEAQKAVHGTIEVIRQLAKDGQLEG